MPPYLQVLLAATIKLVGGGHFNEENSNVIGGVLCSKCPIGANCNVPGTTYNSVNSMKGYSRVLA